MWNKELLQEIRELREDVASLQYSTDQLRKDLASFAGETIGKLDVLADVLTSHDTHTRETLDAVLEALDGQKSDDLAGLQNLLAYTGGMKRDTNG